MENPFVQKLQSVWHTPEKSLWKLPSAGRLGHGLSASVTYKRMSTSPGPGVGIGSSTMWVFKLGGSEYTTA